MPSRSGVAIVLGQRIEHRHHQVELAGRLVLFEQTEPRAQIAEDVGVGPRLADRVDDRPPQVEVIGP